MKQQLNFNWKFTDSFKEEYLKSLPKESEIVNIPHNVKDVPYNYFDEKIYQKVVTYEKIFDVDNDISNSVTILRFDAFMLKAKIYLNDHFYGEYVSGYIPVEIDVSEFIKQKNNRLVVVLESNEDKNYPPFGYAVDYLTFSGIYREVSIEVHPKTYIRDIYVFANSKGEMQIGFTKIGNSKSFSYVHEVLDNNKVIAKFNTPTAKIENIIPWDIVNPKLYVLRTTILSGDGSETYLTRFGFRDISWKKDGFYLNNKKIKLIGLNRHQSYPIIGYAASKSLQEDDANLLKYVAGVNVVRTSHYPDSEHFLNRCDEIGLLVVNEIPGWQHIGKEEIWRNQFYKNVEKMVITERNHPALIIHGVRIDESQDDHELYIKANEIAHKLDPFRPTLGVRNFTNSELLEDVYAYNDFVNESIDGIGLINPKKVKSNGHPYLVSEYMGHMDPTKATSDVTNKAEQALRHLRVINDNLKYDNIAGAIGWCFADYHTHGDFGSGDHICPHGVFDIYRNKKYAASAYSSQQDDFPVLEVLSNMKPGDLDNAIFGEIYVLTNCDYVKLYKNDEFVGDFYPLSKDKRFSNLKHPPIYIDDLVGETFKEERFNKKSWKKIGKMFSYAAIHGFNKMKKSQLLYLAMMMAKYKLSYAELVAYWNKHVGSWGGIAKRYRYDGIKDGKVVKSVTIGPSYKFDLNLTTNKNELVNEDTYDTLRISLEYVDEYNSIMEYANKPINVSVSGPIELIGESSQVLNGGKLSLYIKSKQEKGTGKVTIKLEDITKVIEIPVR